MVRRIYRDLGQQSGKTIFIREVLLVRIRASVKAGPLDWWLTSIVFSGSLRSEYSVAKQNQEFVTVLLEGGLFLIVFLVL